jgi:hypothetical protein
MACHETTRALASLPDDPLAAQLARINFGQTSTRLTASRRQPGNKGPAARASARAADAFVAAPVATDMEALPSAAGAEVLAQAVCVLAVVNNARLACSSLRPVNVLDAAAILPENVVILQLSGFRADTAGLGSAALLVSLTSDDYGPAVLHFGGSLAGFGPDLPLLADGCVKEMLLAPPRLDSLAACPQQQQLDPYWRPQWGSKYARTTGAWQLGLWAWQQAAQLEVDPWLVATPTRATCAAVLQQQQHHHQQQSGPAGPGPSNITATLGASCAGYDPNIDGPGSWLPFAAFLERGSACASDAVAAAAQRGSVWSARQAALPLTAPLVLAQPGAACSRVANVASLAGSIAVVRRGGCSFLDKAMVMADAGAVGMVVLNAEAHGQLLTMSDDGSGRQPGMPVTMLDSADSATLLWWLQRRPLLGTLLAHSKVPQPGDGQLQSLAQLQKQQQAKEQQQAAKEEQPQPPQGEVEAILHTRVDLFVPARTQGWMAQHVVKAGLATQAAYQALVQDPAVTQVLTTALVQNRAHNHKSQVASQHTQAAVAASGGG